MASFQPVALRQIDMRLANRYYQFEEAAKFVKTYLGPGSLNIPDPLITQRLGPLTLAATSATVLTLLSLLRRRLRCGSRTARSSPGRRTSK